MTDYELSSQYSGWTCCLCPEKRILPTWSKWRLVIWWLWFQLHRLFTLLWGTEIFKLCNIETPKRVIFSLIYLATYEWFSYLLMSVILCIRKMEPKYLCRDWYSSDLLFTSIAGSPFLRKEMWAQERHGSCDVLRQVPSSAKPGAQDLQGLLWPRPVPQGGIQPPCASDAHHAPTFIHILLKTLAFCSQKLWVSVRKLS